MISGIGIDLVEIDRIQAVLKRNRRFPRRILTVSELKIYQSYKGKRALQFLAGRFAAKEAYSKALGTGIGQISFQDIEVLPNELGQPKLTEHPSSDQALISITHTDKIAAAQVLLQSI